VADAIGFLTGARFWMSPVGVSPVEFTFFGFEHEVDVARYLLEICGRAMRQEHNRLNRSYGLLVPAARRRKVLPFLDGMADSLRRRIRALREQQSASTGKELIIVRNELIDAALADMGINLKDRSTRRSRDWERSYLDGQRAGERVSLNKGVRGPNSPDIPLLHLPHVRRNRHMG
jgi:hypothetical protein